MVSGVFQTTLELSPRSRYDAIDVRARIAEIQGDLASPTGAFTHELILNDPLGLMPLFTDLPVDEIGERFALPAPWWRTWLQHETEDEYWYKMEIIHHFDRIRLPIYHVGGWHDDFCSVPIENFLAAPLEDPATVIASNSHRHRSLRIQCGLRYLFLALGNACGIGLGEG